MPDAVEGRSYAGAAVDLSGSNSFDCRGYRGLGNVEENSGGLRTSVMVVGVKAKVIPLIVYPGRC